MMSQRSDLEERFLYRGNGFAVGGYMKRPYEELIETEGACVLPMVGGGHTVEVEGYNYRDLVSFGAARSKVLGNVDTSLGERVYNTLVTVTVEDLKIADLVTADRVTARLVSEKIEGGPELPMSLAGSSITNLRIAGEPVDLPTHDVLFRATTLDQIRRHRSSEILNAFGHTLKIPGLSEVHAEGGSSTYEDHRVLTSLYRVPERLPAGCIAGKSPQGEPLYPWGIHIPGFGTVYLGELLITRFSRRLTMIRVKMGSPEEGEVQVVSTEGNGSTYP